MGKGQKEPVAGDSQLDKLLTSISRLTVEKDEILVFKVSENTTPIQMQRISQFARGIFDGLGVRVMVISDRVTFCTIKIAEAAKLHEPEYPEISLNNREKGWD